MRSDRGDFFKKAAGAAATLAAGAAVRVGIFKLAPEKVEAGNEQITRVKVEMYGEEATFQFGRSAASC